MRKTSFYILAGLGLTLSACSGPSLEARYQPACEKIALEADDMSATQATGFCKCMFGKAEATLDADNLETFVTVFETAGTPQAFENKMEEALEEDLYDKLGDEIDNCPRDY